MWVQNTWVTSSNLGVFSTLMEIFGHTITFWICLSFSQICISTGLALWHLLPNALPYGADIWFWGKITQLECLGFLFHCNMSGGWAVMFCIWASFSLTHSVSCLLLLTKPVWILSFLGYPFWPQPIWGDALLRNMAADWYARGGQDFKPRPPMLQARARESGEPGYPAEQLCRDETCVRLSFGSSVLCVCGFCVSHPVGK